MKKLIYIILLLPIIASAQKPDFTRTPNGPNTILDWNLKAKTLVLPHGPTIGLFGSQDTTGNVFFHLGGGDTSLNIRISSLKWWSTNQFLLQQNTVPVIYKLPAGAQTPVIINFTNNTIQIGTASPVNIGSISKYKANPKITFETIISSNNTVLNPSPPWISNKNWTDNTYTSLISVTLQPDTDTGLPGGLTLDNINIIIKP